MTRTVFTTITPLPAGISRETVLATLHSHIEMIDLNPSHDERHMIKAPPEASPEEYHCQWYSVTDKISYIPGLAKGKISFKVCFHDLATGLQTHVYAPTGLDIKEKWTLAGNLPHEPVQPAELGLGVPVSGLYLREDVEIKCNFLVTRFVRKTLKDSLATLVARLVVKSQLQEAVESNRRLTYSPTSLHQSLLPQDSPPLSSPLPGYAALATPPMSPPYTASVNGEMRPAWAQDEQQRYSMKSQFSSPGFVPQQPDDYNQLQQPVISEMEARPKPPAELP